MKALIKSCEFHKISRKTSHPTAAVTNLIKIHQAGNQSKFWKQQFLQTFFMNILGGNAVKVRLLLEQDFIEYNV